MPDLVAGIPSAWLSRVPEIGPLLTDEAHALAVIGAWATIQASPARAATPAAGMAPGYGCAVDGVAIIPVAGPLLNFGVRDLGEWGATSYGWLTAGIEAARADPAVRAVLLAIDSPGGVVAGIEATTDALRGLAAVKPLVAHVDGLGASAAYWLAAQAPEISLTSMSLVGSIGVYAAHMEFSKYLEKLGITATVIKSGAVKAEGNPYEPLSDAARTRLQAQVDDMRQTFAEAVAAGRGGRLGVTAALKTEAAVYFGRSALGRVPEAVAAGLADRVSTRAAVLATLKAGRAPAKPKAQTMTDISKADHDAAVAKATTDATAKATGEANARLSAILSGDGIKGNAARIAAAADLAARSPSMSAADVIGFVVANVGADTAAPAAVAGGQQTPPLAARTAAAQPVPVQPGAAAQGDAPPPKAKIDTRAIYARLNDRR